MLFVIHNKCKFNCVCVVAMRTETCASSSPETPYRPYSKPRTSPQGGTGAWENRYAHPDPTVSSRCWGPLCPSGSDGSAGSLGTVMPIRFRRFRQGAWVRYAHPGMTECSCSSVCYAHPVLTGRATSSKSYAHPLPAGTWPCPRGPHGLDGPLSACLCHVFLSVHKRFHLCSTFQRPQKAPF